jgi:hypothetical protein
MYKKSNSNMLTFALSFTLVIFGILSIIISNFNVKSYAESSILPLDFVDLSNLQNYPIENYFELNKPGDITFKKLPTPNCPTKVNNSDFYYKGGNFSVQNTSPQEVKNITVSITLPAGTNVTPSSRGGYTQDGNILKYKIASISAYSNVDTSYIHDYQAYWPVSTEIKCGY